MTPRLHTPDAIPVARNPDAAIARAYVRALAAAGLEAAVPNVATHLFVLTSGDRMLPVTVDDGAIGGSYVTRPHSAYIAYAREELRLNGLRWTGLLAHPLIWLADGLLRLAAVNRVVMIDNWLLSTNLHGDWNGENVPAIRTMLTSAFPGHALAVRSVDDWTCPALDAALRADGWMMLAARQIWVTDDPARTLAHHRDIKHDRRKLAKSGLAISNLTDPDAADAERIATLYRALYLGKYSMLNPDFTATWIHLAARAGLITFRVARNVDGIIMAMAGIITRGGVQATPIVGYDPDQPKSAGLYRIASLMLSDAAAEAGVRINGSAGAARFKRNRGAVGRIEYTAFAIDHLPRRRRAAFRLMRLILDGVAVPVMRRLAL